MLLLSRAILTVELSKECVTRRRLGISDTLRLVYRTYRGYFRTESGCLLTLIVFLADYSHRAIGTRSKMAAAGSSTTAPARALTASSKRSRHRPVSCNKTVNDGTRENHHRSREYHFSRTGIAHLAPRLRRTKEGQFIRLYAAPAPTLYWPDSRTLVAGP